MNCYVVFGNKQHGKNALADGIAACLSWRCMKFSLESFAEPVKHIALHLLGMPKEIAWGNEKQRNSWSSYGKTAREWLQWIGTELGREQIDADVWVERMAQRVLEAAKEGVTCVVSDGRFRNELHGLREKLGDQVRLVAVKILRPGLEFPGAGEDTHKSESEVRSMDQSEFDFTVVNDGSLEDLIPVARTIVASSTRLTHRDEHG